MPQKLLIAVALQNSKFSLGLKMNSAFFGGVATQRDLNAQRSMDMIWRRKSD